MTDNVQPVKNNQQIRFTGLNPVGDQKKQGDLADKLPKKKVRKKKQNQEKDVQNDADEDATPFMVNEADKDELTKNGRGSIIDLEI